MRSLGRFSAMFRKYLCAESEDLVRTFGRFELKAQHIWADNEECVVRMVSHGGRSRRPKIN